MPITINSKGAQQGPFPAEQVKQLLQSGQVSASDLGWSPGMAEWKPLSSFQELQDPPAIPPAVPPAVPPAIPPAIPPTPHMGVPPLAPAQAATEPLAIWSLVLGIISIVGCAVGGSLAGIPAVICGHFGRSKIRKNPSLRGAGMALAGLITGYLAIAAIPVAIAVAIALPAITMAVEKGKATQVLSNMRQIHSVMVQAQLDGTTTGDPKLGWPASAKIKTKAALKQMLVNEQYITASDLDRLGFDNISVANVSDADPADTIFLKAISPEGKSITIMRKSGDGAIYRPGQNISAPEPPRSPAFLE